jgi:hypothetical protein
MSYIASITTGGMPTLSMLARYQPAQWVVHIDVNSSPFAVALERLLDDALIAVPRLVYSTLLDLAASSG